MAARGDEPEATPGSEAGADLVDEATRRSDRADAQRQGSPDSMPTEEEERAAERAAAEAPDVSEAYEEMMETGANVEGEGRIG